MKRIKSDLKRRRIQRFVSNRLAMVGLSLLAIIALMCIAAPLLTHWDPSQLNPRDKLLSPSAEHLLGTDQLGRDLFARILYGGRVSIVIGLLSAILSTAVGVLLGCIASYYGGKVDTVIIYTGELFACFPSMILVMLIISYVQRSAIWMIVVFVLTGWVGSMRLIRSRLLSLKEEPFIDSCRVNGVSGASIMFRHLLPNAVGPITVNITVGVSGYVLAEAGLSFLGIGVPPTVPTWGNMINAAKSMTVMMNSPALWIFPGIAISLFVLGCNFFGDGLRDALDVTQ